MKLPSMKSKKVTERKLACWIANHKSSPMVSMIPDISIKDREWERNFNKLVEFVKENNRYPSYNRSDEKKMGTWVAHQKRQNKNEKYLKERIAKLEKLPNWKWNPDHEEMWGDKFEDFMSFTEKNNRLPSQSKSASEDELRISRWVQNQMRKPTECSTERMMVLSVIELFTN